jgi:hypothetical protein
MFGSNLSLKAGVITHSKKFRSGLRPLFMLCGNPSLKAEVIADSKLSLFAEITLVILINVNQRSRILGQYIIQLLYCYIPIQVIVNHQRRCTIAGTQTWVGK